MISPWFNCNNLKYLNKMHSMREIHQNINCGYLRAVELWVISTLLSRVSLFSQLCIVIAGRLNDSPKFKGTHKC